jgi:hypothetical protein
MMLGFAKKGDADPYCLTVDTVFDECIRLWKKTMVAVGPPIKFIPDAEDIQRAMIALAVCRAVRTDEDRVQGSGTYQASSDRDGDDAEGNERPP